MSLLPQELVNEVIFLLRNEKITLRFLSLVNRTIAIECQSHLFSHIVVRGPNKPMHEFGGSTHCLQATIFPGEISWKYGFDIPYISRVDDISTIFPPFTGNIWDTESTYLGYFLWKYDGLHAVTAALKRLLESSPHLAKHARCLEIFDTRRHTTRASVTRGDESTMKRWLPKDRYLASCIPNFTNLEAFIIQFHTNEFPVQLTDVPQGLLDCCRNVLRLPRISFVCISDVPVLTFLEQGVNLKHLWVCEGFYDPTQTPHTSTNGLTIPSKPIPISLQSLCLEQKSSNGIPYHYFLDPHCRFSITNLRKLAITVAPRDYSQISQILDLCANTCEDLEFVASIWCLMPLIGGENIRIDGSRFARLRRLKIQLHRDSHIRNLPWISTLLKSFSSVNLRELVLCLVLKLDFNEIYVDGEGWKGIFDCLLEDKFEGLEALTINVYVPSRGSPWNSQDVVDALQASDGVGKLRMRENMNLAINNWEGQMEWRPDNFPPNHPTWQPTPTIVRLN